MSGSDRPEAQLLSIGRHALEGASLDDVFTEAAELLEFALDVSHVGLIRFIPDTNRAMVMLARGWSLKRPGDVVPCGPGSLGAYIAEVGGPLATANMERETRFVPSVAVREEGLVSCLAVRVPGSVRPWGMLAVHTRAERDYDAAAAELLAAAADVLAAAIRRIEFDEYLVAVTSGARLAFLLGRLGAWSWNEQTSAVQWSEELEAVYGIEPGSFPGTFEAFLEHVHPDDRAAAIESIQSARDAGVDIHFEHRIIRPDGEVRWIEGRGRSLELASGGRLWVGIGIDVTERKQAVEERDRLLALEQEARHAAERASNDLALALTRERMLHEASQLLLSPLERVEMMDRFVRLPIPDFADYCTITLVDDLRPGRLVPAAVAHVDEALEARLRDLRFATAPTTGGTTATSVAIRSGEPQIIETVRPAMRAGGFSEGSIVRLAEDVAVASALSVPMVVRDRVIGAVTFMLGERSSRRFSTDDLPFADELARHCADALERVGLRVMADRARSRLALLARVGELMEVQLDAGARLGRLGEILLPALGVACATFLVEGDSLRLVTLARDAGSGGREVPIDRERRHGLDSALPWVRAVARDREVVADISDDQVPEGSDESEREAFSVALGFGVEGVLAVPMRLDGRVIGALAFGRTEADQLYDEDDVALALEIARRVAPAVAHAISYERERETATVLQRSLLPASIPSTRDVVTEGRYLSGTQGLRVGGDWYDVVQLAEGRMLLVIGDVVGHGVRAAALMGQLRTAVRIGALENPAPAWMLTRLNRFISGIDSAAMATCLIMSIDPITGDVEWSSAGHPPAVLRHPLGHTEWLSGGLGPPVGVIDDVTYPSAKTSAAPGSRLVLFTDGLYERRGSSIDERLDMVERVVAEELPALSDVCDRLLTTLLGDGRLADDVAVLGVDLVVPRGSFERTFPADPSELVSFRAALGAWLATTGLAPTTLGDLVLASSELAANAIEHGYRDAPGEVEVRAGFDGDAIVVDVIDRGTWREPAAKISDRGRGLKIARSLVEDVIVESTDSGTTATLRVRHAPPDPPVQDGFDAAAAPRARR